MCLRDYFSLEFLDKFTNRDLQVIKNSMLHFAAAAIYDMKLQSEILQETKKIDQPEMEGEQNV